MYNAIIKVIYLIEICICIIYGSGMESGSSERNPHGDRKWIIHGLPRHRGQPAMHAGSLSFIRAWASRGDVADPEWFTHDHCEYNHSEDPDSMGHEAFGPFGTKYPLTQPDIL